MFDHGVPRYLRPVADDLQFPVVNPLGHVVVLPSPAPEQVGETIDSLELVHRQGGHSAEYVIVGESVEKAVDADGHVSGLDGAGVEVPVVLG